MSFNRGDIRTVVRRRLEEFATTVVTDADLNQEIAYTISDLTNKINFRELLTSDITLLTVADQVEYTLPVTDIRRIFYITINNTQYY